MWLLAGSAAATQWNQIQIEFEIFDIGILFDLSIIHRSLC